MEACINGEVIIHRAEDCLQRILGCLTQKERKGYKII